MMNNQNLYHDINMLHPSSKFIMLEAFNNHEEKYEKLKNGYIKLQHDCEEKYEILKNEYEMLENEHNIIKINGQNNDNYNKYISAKKNYIDLCKLYATSDLPTNDKIYINKIDELNRFNYQSISDINMQLLVQDKLYSFKHLLVTEYLFNNIIADNSSDYLCDRIYNSF